MDRTVSYICVTTFSWCICLDRLTPRSNALRTRELSGFQIIIYVYIYIIILRVFLPGGIKHSKLKRRAGILWGVILGLWPQDDGHSIFISSGLVASDGTHSHVLTAIPPALAIFSSTLLSFSLHGWSCLSALVLPFLTHSFRGRPKQNSEQK